MLGRDLTAAEALSWGLVTGVAGSGGCMDDAMALSRQLAASSSSVGPIKRALLRGADAELADQLAYEAELQPRLQQHPDFAEAISAFAEKRPPRYGARVATAEPAS